MASIFDSVKITRPKRNVFNLSHDWLGACDMGQVVPVFVMNDLLPGSTVKVSTGQITRFQSLLAPIMHNINAYITFWAVPYRLLDPNFPDFISGKLEFENEEYDAPYFTYDGISSETIAEKAFLDGTLFDFLGYPTAGTRDEAYDTISGSTLHLTPRPFVAYLMILYQRYINENIMSGSIEDLFGKGGAYENLLEEIKVGGDVSDSVANCLNLLYQLNTSCCFPHGWNKDYFTSALPFTQIGSPVTIPLSGSAPVHVTLPASIEGVGIASPELTAPQIHDSAATLQFYKKGQSRGTMRALDYAGTDAVEISTVSGTLNMGGEKKLLGETDLSEVSALSIIELRIANALQSYKEQVARQGHRFYEYLLGTWGVTTQDSRLQLPQRIASGVVPVTIIPVEQTSATTNAGVKGDTTPAGNLTARATARGFGFCDFTFYVHEDSLIMGLLTLQPKTMYGNRGVNRHLLKTGERFDFLHPKFEHIGEQEILNAELYMSGDDDTDSGVFGYTARYAEYKHWDNEIHGQLNNVLAFWHLGRIFNETPTLSPSFIYINADDVKRPFAVQNVTDVSGDIVPLQNCLNDLYFKVTYKAPMSHYGTPRLLN